MPSKSANSQRVAIVGASSLLGKELKQVIEERRFPATDILLLDASVLAGTLTEAAGEPTFIREISEDSFEGVNLAFFAGSAADTEQNWQAAQRAGAAIIDLTGSSAVTPVARLIPSLASVLPPRGPEGGAARQGHAFASPSAAVIVGCTLVAALAKFRPERIVAQLFPPVSERDQAGIDELESQTTNLLSFRQIGQQVFDAQVAFNLLAQYGAAAKPRLADARAAIGREVAAYLAGRIAAPAIQLLQAPVFYGYAFSAYADLGATVAPQIASEIESSFAALGAKIAAADDPPPDNVSVAGESEIQLGRVSIDPNLSGGIWIWGVADHLRLAATNAVRIAEELIASPN